ncbi:MAG: TonB-dependent receptor [Bryobacteraceae bacterium]|nr:TonB-dependent receptor [Bryobacteraceae bacterium]
MEGFRVLPVSIGFFVLLGGLPLGGQQGVSSATLGGRLEDASGAAVEDIEIALVNLDRNQTARVRTDGQGYYQFLHVAPGEYEVRVDNPPFSPVARPLTVAAGQALQAPIRLALAGQSESIEVTASALALETARTQVSEFVRPVEIDSLPLNGRNYLDLALLVPGVSRTNTGTPQQFAETSAVPGTGISFSSQRNLNNNFVLDGLSLNDDAAGLAGAFFSQEVIREFQAVNAGGTAEFGRSSSGVLNITSKSGTNQLHGRLYGFVRNQRFDARNPLATRKDPLTQTQYGASLGGPIRRDKTFFFSNFEQTHRHAAGFVTIAPANVAAINAALAANPAYRGPRVTTGEYATGWDMSSFFARMDHQVSAGNQLAWRYSFYDIGSPNARGVGGLNDVSRGTRLDNRDQTVAVTDVATLSPRTVNEARFQFARGRLAAPGNDLTGPAVNIAGIGNFGASTTSPVGRENNLFQANDSLSMVRGSHSLRAGADFMLNRLNIYFPGSQIAAAYAFSNLANFQTGRYQTFQQAFGDPYQFQSNPNLGFFLQDEWRLLPRLTLQLGLRYDIQWLTSPIQTDYNNVAPRFGIAWSPGENTVIRASYGLFYDRVPLRATSNALQRDGSKYRVALLSFGQAGAPAFPFQAEAFPPGLNINITTIDPRIQNSYAHQAGFQIERRLGAGLSVSAGYQWLRALHLILSRNVNVPTLTAAEAAARGVPNLGRLDSRYGNVSRYEGAGDSYYNGLLLSAQYRPARRASVRLSYNFSKAIDDVGNFFFSAPQDNFNLRDDRGRSDNDQRHRITASAVLESPFGNALLRGWQLAPLFLYTSRLPFNIQLGFDRNGDTNTNDRPVGVGRNTGRGFDYASFDFRLSRTFRLTENWSLQGLAEAFNSLNRTNRAVPNNTITAPTFGRATAVYDPRQIQFGLRLSF